VRSAGSGELCSPPLTRARERGKKGPSPPGRGLKTSCFDRLPARGRERIRRDQFVVAAILRGGGTLLVRSAAAFFVVFPAVVATRSNRAFVFVTFHARLFVFTPAAGGGRFSGAARIGFLVRCGLLVMATGVFLFRASRFVAARAITFCMRSGAFLRGCCSRSLGCGLSPGRNRQGQDQCGQFEFHDVFSISMNDE
jgi:hypothetical protein